MSMSPSQLLALFLVLRLLQQCIESVLSFLNHRYVQAPKNHLEAAKILNLSQVDLQKSLAYASDRFRFNLIASPLQLIASLLFLGLGGFGWLETIAKEAAGSFGSGQLIVGLVFFAGLGVLNYVLSLPFDLYHTFVLEQKHGFNRQTPKGFLLDQIKMMCLSVLLGGLVLALLLTIMQQAGDQWWWMAWLTVFGFSLLTAWLYPTFLAPLFNKFSPLEEGALKEAIFSLAKKVAFNADSISIMDASKRSSHGNAYFTGVFGKKRIVLFDTLVKAMGTQEIVAVLAHELGHFKLHHVRQGLVRSFFITGLMFFALSQCLPLEVFYQAFHLQGVSSYGALVVFSLWFGPFGFLMQPINSFISRRHEFQADAFAKGHIENKRALGDALLKLRETSHVMPISHPVFSAVYHSHPPLLERLKAMGYIG